MLDPYSIAKPTIVLVHPNRLFAEGLGSLLEGTPYQLARHAVCFEDIQPDDLQPDNKLLFMVGGRSAVQIAETIRCIRSRLGYPYIVVLGATSDPDDVMSALEAGANGYLREAVTSQSLIRAIELLVQDETVLPPEFVKCLHSRGNAKEGSSFGPVVPEFEANAAVLTPERPQSGVRLSSREGTILEALVEGDSNKVIAQRLNITEATVKVHVKAILRKIRVKNRTQAAIWGVKHLSRAQTVSDRADGQHGNGLWVSDSHRAASRRVRR
jgi:two-component system nitrate/nitrite response regulator NarL